VNLITSSSNSGKTRFLKEIVAHRDRFFASPESIRRVIYINANGRDPSFRHPWIREVDAASEDQPDGEDFITDPSLGLEVVSLALDEFLDPASTLNALDIVVFDDLLQISEQVDFVLKYATHHFRLFVFVVTQSCLSSPLYRLLQSAHNVVLLFGNTGCTRLAQHLIQAFFFCSDTKAYLKAILGVAERQQDVVLLKLNSVASYRLHSHVLALSRVQGLFEEDPPYCFLYPELGHSEYLEPAAAAAAVTASSASARTSNAMNRADSRLFVGELPRIRGQFLEEAYVLLPASRVRQIEGQNGGADGEEDDEENNYGALGNEEDPADSLSPDKEGTKGADCLKEKRRQWIKLNAFLKREIEETFPVRRWVPARNLTRELLRSKELCVTPDHRTIFVRSRPKWRFSIIDFLNLATRKAGPAEIQSEKVMAYLPLVNILLKNNVPETFFINRVLLAAAQTAESGGRKSGGSRRSRRNARRRLRVPNKRGRRRQGQHQPSQSPYWQPQQQQPQLFSPYPPPRGRQFPWTGPGWVNQPPERGYYGGGGGGYNGYGGNRGDMTHMYHV